MTALRKTFRGFVIGFAFITMLHQPTIQAGPCQFLVKKLLPPEKVSTGEIGKIVAKDANGPAPRSLGLLLSLADNPQLSASDRRLIQNIADNIRSTISQNKWRDGARLIDGIVGTTAWAMGGPIFIPIVDGISNIRFQRKLNRIMNRIRRGDFDSFFEERGIQRTEDVRDIRHRKNSLTFIKVFSASFLSFLLNTSGLNPISEHAIDTFHERQNIRETRVEMAVGLPDYLEEIEKIAGRDLDTAPVYIFVDHVFDTPASGDDDQNRFQGFEYHRILEKNPNAQMQSFSNTEELASLMNSIPRDNAEPPFVIVQFHGGGGLHKVGFTPLSLNNAVIGGKNANHDLETANFKTLPNGSDVIFSTCNYGNGTSCWTAPQDEPWIRFANHLAGSNDVNFYSSTALLVYTGDSQSPEAVQRRKDQVNLYSLLSKANNEITNNLFKVMDIYTELGELKEADAERIQGEINAIHSKQMELDQKLIGENADDASIINLRIGIIEIEELRNQLSQKLVEILSLAGKLSEQEMRTHQLTQELSEGLDQLNEQLDRFKASVQRQNERMSMSILGLPGLNYYQLFASTMEIQLTPETSTEAGVRVYHSRTGSLEFFPLVRNPYIEQARESED